LIFAGPRALDVHLVRHQLADLFLDTLPYNAHATACDALWAGLPVLTRRGTAYAGRVAASFLTAAGLPELITETAEDYESSAWRWRAIPSGCSPARQARRQPRHRALFDTPRLARDLEALYCGMLAAAVK
jgi:predicted O-linked N-acetylglucosamine transferase (SPINDLY family)